MSIESGDDIAANQSGFVGRRSGRFDIVEADAAVRRVKTINSSVRPRDRSRRSASVETGAERSEAREATGHEEKDNQRQKHPGHSAHSPAAKSAQSSHFTPSRSCYWPAAQPVVGLVIRRGRRRRSNARAIVTVLETNGLSVFRQSFSESIAAVPTKAQSTGHRRMAVGTSCNAGVDSRAWRYWSIL